MSATHEANKADPPASEYRTPELVVHGDVAELTAGQFPGTTDSANQGSALPGDAGSG